jgi:hypothetical protein
MRELRGTGVLSFPSLEVFSVLQFCVINEPLLPNLKTLRLWLVIGEFIPFTPLFLSPTTTVINTEPSKPDLPSRAMIAWMVAPFLTLCPNLRKISLHSLPRDPIATAAASELVLTTNRDALRHFHADSPLTEEAREVICKLPNLCELWVVIEGPTPLPAVALPNLRDRSRI